jgi:ubiquinone/menaquinone biosynthesis C-methylase UbiE
VTTDRGLLFDRVAEEYDRARPDYPVELVEAAERAGGLGPGSHVVEVGCGTGKLTALLVERGLRVEAVDPGANLVEIARTRLRGAPVRFHLGRFEDVELPPRAFEAIFSATAFHRVDPAVGWAKAARLLRPGGVLALIAYVGDWSLELGDEFLAAWREVLPEAAGWVFRDAQALWEGAEARLGNVSELWAWLEKNENATPEAARLFGDVQLVKIPIETAATVEESLALVRTQSAYLLLTGDRRKLLERRLAAILERGGGLHRSTSFATLVTARVRR